MGGSVGGAVARAEKSMMSAGTASDAAGGGSCWASDGSINAGEGSQSQKQPRASAASLFPLRCSLSCVEVVCASPGVDGDRGMTFRLSPRLNRALGRVFEHRPSAQPLLPTPATTGKGSAGQSQPSRLRAGEDAAGKDAAGKDTEARRGGAARRPIGVRSETAKVDGLQSSHGQPQESHPSDIEMSIYRLCSARWACVVMDSRPHLLSQTGAQRAGDGHSWS